MAEYMQEHPDLARNILPNCVQRRTVAQRLWEQLSLKLNSAGPPIKELKMWRKVFADQRQNVKKKLSFNKASKQKTGGGPYQEKLLTASEELLLQATAMDVSMEYVLKTFTSQKR
ncbi:uncharacterized protein LOC118740516 [Rhagoletis pomonella]|uniref:uncharacterized protein LOC118740516 n=1 Tax=Rhagoletis pomonella TaxID=28610 RepID=UPI00178084C1|nr:uncharacterized protein LOC118740516 [Rhagoletis pomonella]